MRNRLFAIAMMATSGLALAATPMMAEAKGHRVLVCDKNIRTKSNNGTLIGAVGGGLLGNAVAGHGNKTGGTLIGAGVGAVAGHEVAKSRAKKRHCHYVYR